MEVKKLKRIGILIAVLALLLFIFTNTESTEISVFLWHPEVPLILVMMVPLLIGLALGVYIARNVGKDKNAPSSKITVDEATAKQ